MLEDGERKADQLQVKSHGRLPVFGGLGISRSMRRDVLSALEKADIVHSHGLWMAPNIYPGLLAEEDRSAALVVSPRGTLAPWAWSWKAWKKRPLWHLGQRRTLERADGFHATAEAEVDHIRERGFEQPVAVVPNGVEVPSLTKKEADPWPRETLFLSRIHPKKGLPMLLRAWSQVAARRDDWRLRIVGPDEEGHGDELAVLADHLNLENVSFEGPAFGREKSAAYRRASLFVLPTRSENFGIVVAEALAHGVPVLTTKAAPWAGLEERDCGWWVDPEVDAIASRLRQALELSQDQLDGMGRRGRRWMAEEFSWRVQGNKMHGYYEWLMDGGEPPPFVRLK